MKRLAHSLQGVAVCQRERKRNGNMLKMQKSGGWMQHTGRFSLHYLAKHNVKHEVIENLGFFVTVIAFYRKTISPLQYILMKM